MRTINTLSLTLSLVIGAVLAPAAHAQNASASGKHIAVIAGGAQLQDGGPAPTLSANYYFNDNWAVEVWGNVDAFKPRLKSAGGKALGTMHQQSIAVSGQYHFGDADNVFRPFLGVGYHQTNFSNEKLAFAGPGRFGLEDAKGVMGTAGVDMNINERWFARADVRYLRGNPAITIDGKPSDTKAKIGQFAVGFGLGARF